MVKSFIANLADPVRDQISAAKRKKQDICPGGAKYKIAERLFRQLENVPFIKFNLEFLEHLLIFLQKSFLSMMFFLIQNVINNQLYI